MHTKKIIIGIFAMLVLVILASGCTSPGNNTTQPTNNSNQSNSSVTVQINSTGSWNGDIASTHGDQIVNGTDNALYNLGTNPGNVVVTITKNASNMSNLTVQIIQGGNIIANGSTSAVNGTVKVSHRF